MTPAQQRQESLAVMRGMLACGLVIAAPLLLTVAWLAWGPLGLVTFIGGVLALTLWSTQASKRGAK